MKKITRGLSGVALFLIILIGSAFMASAEVKDLGEVCFNMSWDDVFEGVGGQLQAGVLSFGNGHFILDGKIVPLIILDPNGHVHGSATLDGNSITMSLALSDAATLTSPLSGRVSLIHIVLDSTTLSGRWVATGYNFRTAPDATSGELFGGTISIAQCRQ